LPKKIVLHKNDRFGQTRVSSDRLLPSPFFSGENARPNGKYTRPNGENTRSRGLTISHNGIYLYLFSGRVLFRKNGNMSSEQREKYHMEDPGIGVLNRTKSTKIL